MADTYDIRANQNADLLVTFQSLDSDDNPLIDLTDYEIKAQVREDFGDTDPLMELTTAIIDAAQCQYSISATAAELWAISAAVTAYYDVLAIKTGSPTISMVRGRFILVGAATEP